MLNMIWKYEFVGWLVINVGMKFVCMITLYLVGET